MRLERKVAIGRLVYADRGVCRIQTDRDIGLNSTWQVRWTYYQAATLWPSITSMDMCCKVQPFFVTFYKHCPNPKRRFSWSQTALNNWHILLSNRKHQGAVRQPECRWHFATKKCVQKIKRGKDAFFLIKIEAKRQKRNHSKQSVAWEWPDGVTCRPPPLIYLTQQILSLPLS